MGKLMEAPKSKSQGRSAFCQSIKIYHYRHVGGIAAFLDEPILQKFSPSKKKRDCVYKQIGI
jgi:hypothetical protein